MELSGPGICMGDLRPSPRTLAFPGNLRRDRADPAGPHARRASPALAGRDGKGTCRFRRNPGLAENSRPPGPAADPAGGPPAAPRRHVPGKLSSSLGRPNMALRLPRSGRRSEYRISNIDEVPGRHSLRPGPGVSACPFGCGLRSAKLPGSGRPDPEEQSVPPDRTVMQAGPRWRLAISGVRSRGFPAFDGIPR